MLQYISWIVLSVVLSLNTKPSTLGPGHFYGAWEMKKGDITYTKIYTEGYFIYSGYDLSGKKFIEAGGGTWKLTQNGTVEISEFSTINPEGVGDTEKHMFKGEHDDNPMTLMTERSDELIPETWSKIDDGKSPLFGAWRITQRERNGQMNTMQQGPRKTMKVLSGTRFQWAAYNVETRQFMGTGGGTFTAQDGKYTENIEFFSRDNSRVGAKLVFDFAVVGNDWHHKGFSSKGDPIYEIWTNQD